jgi:hypothetical protein
MAMKLQIERGCAEAMLAQFSDLHVLAEQLKFGNKAEIPFNHLSNQQLDFLHQLYQQGGVTMQGKAAQLSTLKNALLVGGKRFSEGELEQLVPAIAQFLISDAIRGWLFRINAVGRPLAYLVARLDFTPPGEEEAGRILLELKANSMGKIAAVTMMIRERDILEKTIPEIFATNGFLKETPELITTYDRSAARYFEHRSDYSRQFSGSGTGYDTPQKLDHPLR